MMIILLLGSLQILAKPANELLTDMQIEMSMHYIALYTTIHICI